MPTFVRVFPRTTLLLATLVLPLAAQAPPAPSASGSKPITAAEMKRWNSIRQTAYANNGKWFSYLSGPADSDAVMSLRSTARGSAETKINVGNGGGSVAFSGDSKWLAYIVAPARAAGGRGGRGGGGRGGAQGGRGGGGGAGAPVAVPADSAAAPVGSWKMVLTDLATGTKKEFDGIRRFAFNADTPNWIVMQGAGTPAPAGAAGAARSGSLTSGAAGSGGSADLLLYNLATGEISNMSRVDQYGFTKDGNWMAYTVQSADKIGNSVRLMNMKTGITRTLENAPVTYSNMAWIDSSRTLSVVRTVIDSAAKDTTTTWATFTKFTPEGSATLKIVDPAKGKDFPAGYTLVADRAPRYSDDLQTIFFYLREKPKTPAKTVAAGGRGLIQAGAPGAGGNGTTAPGAGRGTAPATNPAADSSVSLILWHYKDTRLQSQQIVQESQDRNTVYQALYRVPDDRVVQLSDSTLKTVVVNRGDKVAYGLDTRDYDERASYTGRNWQDVYRVDLATGKRTLLQKKRWPGTTTVSPDGTRMLYWAKDGNYWVLDLLTGDSVNITKGVPTYFGDLEEDHNNLFVPAAGVRGWSTDGKYVLLSDDWDIWKVPTTPAPAQAVNLTGDGKKNQIRYQNLLRWASPPTASAADGIDLSEPLYLSTYGEWTKKEGVSKIEAGKAGATPLFFEDAKYSIVKARDADTYFWTRQGFTEYPDWWTSGPAFKDAMRLTDANPQIKDLAWSSGTRLINYTTDKGDKLQAAMYLPANYQPGKQYPMLVTIYEKRSQGKNVFISPSETRAPDPSLYTSRGYIVLDPDIVYKINDPGMSAVWAVVPAVKAAIATGSVDARHVGLWGHSWGGYQTAFLVTQTNIFAAAIAGAPLTNMVSMYASIYWNSGASDASIFEASQGRFKGNFIENSQAYIRNSPVFFADKMNTPLIILQNDKDGAVDFNQGVTYYNTLRQLQKPVIFLEYVGENHGLARTPNMKDYATRMSEFFDHYLKDAPAADWITNGVPRIRMEEHLAERRDSAATKPDSARAGAPAGRGGN